MGNAGINIERVRVGAFLKSLRESRNLTIRDLASQVQADGGRLSKSTLNRIEKGEGALDIEDAPFLCRRLGVSVAMLGEVARTPKRSKDAKVSGDGTEALARARKAGVCGRTIEALNVAESVEFALKIGEGNSSPDTFARSLHLQVAGHIDLGNYNIAREILFRSRVIKGQSEDRINIGLCQELILSYKYEDFIHVDAIIEKCKARTAKQSIDRQFCHLAIGNAYLAWADAEVDADRTFPAQAKAKEAARWFEESIRISDQQKPEEKCRSIVGLGFSLAIFSETSRGIDVLAKGETMAGQLKLPAVRNLAQRLLVRCFRRQGDFKRARAWARRALACADPATDPLFSFLSGYELWRVGLDSHSKADVRSAALIMHKLVPRVDAELPPVKEFLEWVGRNGMEALNEKNW